jgi:hypothetical protein
MTSNRRREANRRNAQRSTGPRSATGKRASRSNALRHGLSARLGEDPSHNRRIEWLAQIIAGPEAAADELYYARVAAEATLQIARIRALRTSMLDPSLRSREVLSWSFPQRVTWERRYGNGNLDLNVLADQAKHGPGDGSTPEERAFMLAFPLERTPPIPSGPDAEVEILGRFIGKVAKLDRYEVRELSRRRSAYRALDALRASKAAKTA